MSKSRKVNKDMKTEYRLVPESAQVREEDGQPVITGQAIVYGVESYNEIIAPGAATKSLASGVKIHLFWQHDRAKPFAHTENGTLTLREDEQGVWFEARPNMKLSWGKDAVEAIRDGSVDKMSFGMNIVAYEYEDVDGVWKTTITELDLIEVSPVTYAWYDATSVGVRRNPMIDGIEIPVRGEFSEDAIRDIEAYAKSKRTPTGGDGGTLSGDSGEAEEEPESEDVEPDESQADEAGGDGRDWAIGAAARERMLQLLER